MTVHRQAVQYLYSLLQRVYEGDYFPISRGNAILDAFGVKRKAAQRAAAFAQLVSRYSKVVAFIG
jgi:hypothetical protein